MLLLDKVTLPDISSWQFSRESQCVTLQRLIALTKFPYCNNIFRFPRNSNINTNLKRYKFHRTAVVTLPTHGRHAGATHTQGRPMLQFTDCTLPVAAVSVKPKWPVPVNQSDLQPERIAQRDICLLWFGRTWLEIHSTKGGFPPAARPKNASWNAIHNQKCCQ
jgi:hypothetical protein